MLGRSEFKTSVRKLATLRFTVVFLNYFMKMGLLGSVVVKALRY
jgi:hypothetical protein